MLPTLHCQVLERVCAAPGSDCPCFVKFTFRNRKIRMPKPHNLQLIHSLSKNSNLFGLELKCTNTHVDIDAKHTYTPHMLHICVYTHSYIDVEEGKIRSSKA